MNQAATPQHAAPTAIPSIEFLSYYVHFEGNKTGTFLVHPDEVAGVAAWRAKHGVMTQQAYNRHPSTGQRLPAYQPVEGKLLTHVEVRQRIQHGQLCWVAYRLHRVGGQLQMRTIYERIRPA